MPSRKPYEDQSAEERIASLDRIMNLVVHDDWRDLFLRWSAEANYYQQIMDSARTWEEYLDARGVKQYIDRCLLNLPQTVRAEKEDLEADRAAEEVPIQPTDYEIE